MTGGTTTGGTTTQHTTPGCTTTQHTTLHHTTTGSTTPGSTTAHTTVARFAVHAHTVRSKPEAIPYEYRTYLMSLSGGTPKTANFTTCILHRKRPLLFIVTPPLTKVAP